MLRLQIAAEIQVNDQAQLRCWVNSGRSKSLAGPKEGQPWIYQAQSEQWLPLAVGPVGRGLYCEYHGIL